jgi:2-polyprenyl-3-methyl-5-hydroxy-6-metoxy-1,4-benzoquinol methylase
MAERATFVDRTRCIACASDGLQQLAGGGFADQPLHGILAAQAWGQSPLPFIEHERWSYVRCRACGQAFHRRILAPAWMHRLYTDWETQEAMLAFIAEHESAQDRFDRGTGFATHALQLQRMVGVPSRAVRLLDFGCGHGEFVTLCRALGFDAIGIDFAPDRRAHGLLRTMYVSIDEMRAARAHEPAFDAVTLFEVLEHLADPLGVLRQLWPLMRPGAVLVLETPDTTGVSGLRTKGDYLAIGPLGHINGFTPSSLRAMAERAGFRRVRPPAAWVTASWLRLAKRSARHLLAPLLRTTTRQYFVRE